MRWTVRSGLLIQAGLCCVLGCAHGASDARHDTAAPPAHVAPRADAAGDAGDVGPRARSGRRLAAAPVDSTPVAVVRSYYAAINSRHYDVAYSLWGQGGRASRQSRAQFAAGFANTAGVRVTCSDSVAIEGAAGSQYATIPVTVEATLRDGGRQHFVGTYVLRRAMVTGADEADRRWHIYSAHLTARR